MGKVEESVGISPSEFLVRELRRRRTAAGLTQEALGERVHYSNTHVSAIQTGLKPPKPEYLRAVDEALNTDGFLYTLWEDLVKESAAPVWLREWIEFEREAVALRWYEAAYVPGLLQTEAYARATLCGVRLSAAEIDQRVAARLARQEILDRDAPPDVFVALDEMVLRRQCGNAGVMSEQLDKLIACAERPRLHIHVVPASLGIYPGLAGAFIIAELPDGTRVGHADNQLSAHIVDRPEELASLGVTWDTIRGEALPRKQSLELLKEAAQRWT